MNPDKISKAENYDADIIVIGGGGTGLAAAVTAAKNGRKVVLLEKRAIGGNSAIALGMFAADSPVQRRLNIDAPADKMFRAAMEYSHWKSDPMVVRAFVNKTGDTIQWLEEKGICFSTCTVLHLGNPHCVCHLIEIVNGKSGGYQIVELLRKECDELGVKLIPHCRVKEILTDKGGKVTGVLAKTTEQEIEMKAKSVIIASGGYSGNKKLLKKYYHKYHENLHRVGVPNNGDGLLMAIKAGAATDSLGLLMLHPHIFPENQKVDVIVREPYMLWVNKKGERFVDETIVFNSPECGNALDRQPERLIYVIADNKIIQRIMENGTIRTRGLVSSPTMPDLMKDLQAQAEKGGLKISDNLDDIANWMGASPGTLTATVNKYNASCDKGHDDDFVKDQRYLSSLRTPPYYAIRCFPQFLTTIGGIKINHRMEVINWQDEPIGGLYAGGDAAGGWETDTYCMILPGSALSFALNSGRIAGENAAKYVMEEIA